jgi:hypothetical protein
MNIAARACLSPQFLRKRTEAGVERVDAMNGNFRVMGKPARYMIISLQLRKFFFCAAAA